MLEISRPKASADWKASMSDQYLIIGISIPLLDSVVRRSKLKTSSPEWRHKHEIRISFLESKKSFIHAALFNVSNGKEMFIELVPI